MRVAEGSKEELTRFGLKGGAVGGGIRRRMRGLGLGAFTLDWTAVSSFLFSPLVSPFFATANILAGFLLFMYVAVPAAYWGLDLYNARRFPIFSSHLFAFNG